MLFSVWAREYWNIGRMGFGLRLGEKNGRMIY